MSFRDIYSYIEGCVGHLDRTRESRVFWLYHSSYIPGQSKLICFFSTELHSAGLPYLFSRMYHDPVPFFPPPKTGGSLRVWSRNIHPPILKKMGNCSKVWQFIKLPQQDSTKGLSLRTIKSSNQEYLFTESNFPDFSHEICHTNCNISGIYNFYLKTFSGKINVRAFPGEMGSGQSESRFSSRVPRLV